MSPLTNVQADVLYIYYKNKPPGTIVPEVLCFSPTADVFFFSHREISLATLPHNQKYV